MKIRLLEKDFHIIIIMKFKKMKSDKIEEVLGYRGKDEIIHIDDFVLEN